ncbi:LexA/Signal peptidase [Sporormia fimetaria CBS 119925]|uniref:Mitochondrial inner membrane protease subunit n=1 Tax=Sporormia fimetaria CBS 119925 TaxID=1340428 RepID=A0A6A6VEQ2_9PLEO|nr:LexA/Signal peptidase [Sporormia fimetaria CBS 119925]
MPSSRLFSPARLQNLNIFRNTLSRRTPAPLPHAYFSSTPHRRIFLPFVPFTRRSGSRKPPTPLTTQLFWVVQALLVGHLFTKYYLSIRSCYGPSMLPTIPDPHSKPFLSPNLLISKLHAHGKNVQVGDIVVYKIPIQQKGSGVKRVIGMPGDLVAVVTRGKLDEDLVDLDPAKKASSTGAPAKQFAEVTEKMIRVPEGHCWVVGDNMEWSRDSRNFGPLPLNLVSGKVLAIAWPPSEMKWLTRDKALEDASDVKFTKIEE